MYILDVETRGDKRLLPLFTEGVTAPKNIKDPEKIRAAIEAKLENAEKSMAVDPDYNEVVCVGVKELGQPPKALSLVEFGAWLEEEITDPASNAKSKRMFDHIITFNGKCFDLPVLIKAGIRQNVNLPYKRLKMATKKYDNVGHTDLMDEIAMVYGEQKSLDTYLKIYLGIKKNTGGEDFFRNATDEELRKHCLEDLVFTEQLFNKFKVILSL